LLAVIVADRPIVMSTKEAVAAIIIVGEAVISARTPSIWMLGAFNSPYSGFLFESSLEERIRILRSM